MRSILLVIVLTLMAACSSSKNCVHYDYQTLMMSYSPLHIRGLALEKGYLEFQHFNVADKDTVIRVRIRGDKVKLMGGISVGEDFERIGNFDILNFHGEKFLFVTLRNSGNSHGNRVTALRINPRNGKATGVEFARADSIYSARLDPGQFVWNCEVIRYDSNRIRSNFYIWNESDIHPLPTGGKVDVVYDLKKLGKRKYRIAPVTMEYTPGEFDQDAL